ncbi:RNA-directed DNA polymerase, eukaryota [Tanacetum coccineum]
MVALFQILDLLIADHILVRRGLRFDEVIRDGAGSVRFDLFMFRRFSSLTLVYFLDLSFRNILIMGSFRSKEDEVSKISTSIFVTNFSDQTTAKDLWIACKQYGNVVDSYIPNRRSKAGKRIHANVSRFQRQPVNNGGNQFKNSKGEIRNNIENFHNENRYNGTSNSYAHAVKSGTQSVEVELGNIPALILDDTCVNHHDFSHSLMGKVKEFASLSNLRMVLENEGFDNIVIKYMGGYWVMLEFQSEETNQTFKDNAGVGTWFSQLLNASTKFINDGRVTWVEIEGVPLKLWSENTFNRIASKWGVLLNVDDQEEGCLHRKRLCINTMIVTNIYEAFKIIYHGKTYWIRAKEVPGWVPNFLEDEEEETNSDEDIKEGDSKSDGDNDVEEVPETKFEEELQQANAKEDSVGKKNSMSQDPFNIYELLNKKQDVTEGQFKKDEGSKKEDGECSPNIHTEEKVSGAKEKSTNSTLKEDVAESVCSGHFKKSEVPRTGGSILQLMEDLVKVGHTMGYSMEGCLAQKAKKDWVKELCVKNKVNLLSLQETKMESIELLSVKMCWGNFAFDYVHSDSVGNSGGILCVWDPRYLKKNNVTVSDYFIMIMGIWVPSGKNLLIISVYAPQELSEKKMLWDYFSLAISNWKDEVVVMGEFNEVRTSSERFGLVFNVQGAVAFNTFISKAGLEEVPLGGCSFTWCHKFATKMSKLERFLVSESLMSSCPNISALTLDRYLSDHRPILLREINYDYGPIPFRLFHYWFKVEGFEKLIEDTWNEAPVDDSNAMNNVMKKLKYLKEKIMCWSNDKIKCVQSTVRVLFKRGVI